MEFSSVSGFNLESVETGKRIPEAERVTAMADNSGFLLKCTDEAVMILQSLVTLVGSYYEGEMKVKNSTRQIGAPNMDLVRLTYQMLSELLAKLWPCEKTYVAVIGPTGCGKSTLLNSLIAMTCKTGESYVEGITQDEKRAALRETARHHGRNFDDVGEGDPKLDNGILADPGSTSERLENEDLAIGVPVDRDAERRSICALLGVCCARNRETYFSKHLAICDRNPFLLLNGRMGDAGTTKVTAVEWGPKFTCHIKWMEKKILRKRWKELRRCMEDPNSKQIEESRLNEYKELWERMLSIVGHHFQRDQVPVPTEELIDSTIAKLAKKVSLGKVETIQNVKSKGCVLDRLQVRQGIRRRFFEEKLGLLSEELIIEAPIPSSEGGVSLLDVPGTNDPRFMHQRETRDAIDRTALILLIVDKSVLDEDTVKVLEEGPILERMLLDDTSNCSLVVVGIAEKGIKNNQTAVDVIDNFDPKKDLMKALRAIFLKKAKSLTAARLLDRKVAVQRVHDIFAGDQFSVLPVLPLLCASLHISTSNCTLHEEFCESSGMHSCPLVMSGEVCTARIQETNIPQLLERIQSVRLPPKIDELRFHLKAAKELLEMLTRESSYDESMVEFLKGELKHARKASENLVCIEKFLPDCALDLEWIQEVLLESENECLMASEDMKTVSLKLGSKAAIRAVNNKEIFQLAPVIMHGFRPELIGKIANVLMKRTEENAAAFVNGIYHHLVNSLKGTERRVETAFEQVSVESVGTCVDIIEEVKTRWKHNLDRILARLLCGGKTGGLFKEVRVSLREAYDKSMKCTLKELRRQGNDEVLKEVLLKQLNQNEAGKQVKTFAEKELENDFNEFWGSAIDLYRKEIPKMWKSWLGQLTMLKNSVSRSLEKKATKDSTTNSGEGDRVLQKSLQGKITELQSLLQGLESKETVNYGYSLLQNNPCFEMDLLDKDSKKRSNPCLEPYLLNKDRRKRSNFIMGLTVDTTRDVQSDHESPQGQLPVGKPNLVHGSPRLGHAGGSNNRVPVPSRLQSPGIQRRNVIPLSDVESHNLSQKNAMKNTPRTPKKRKL